MKNVKSGVFLSSLLCFVLSAQIARAQEPKTTISDPAPVKVEDLLKQADLVAIVRILSGDTEHYPMTVYKVEVLQPFKGAEKGAILYLGPFIGYGLGEELLVFLHHSEKGIEPESQAVPTGLSYGPISSFYLVMYDGYSALPVKFDCVFDGKEIAQQCDYGIRINTFQLVLPKSMKTYPSSTRGSFSEETKWVRKTVFLAFLQKLTNPDKL